MYHSKHEKGYVTSHEVKNTHFRTWKSGKKWLYGSATLALVMGSFSNINFSPISTHTQIVSAATTPSNGALTAGGTADTGDHTYGSNIINQASNWSIGGSSAYTASAGEGSAMTTPLAFININTTPVYTTGYAYFNGSSSMSFASGFTISANFQSNKAGSLSSGIGGLFTDTGPFGVGDGMGFFLTPNSKAQMKANFDNAPVPPIVTDPSWANPTTNPRGGGLGIAGLTNTIFAGRDFYNNGTGYGTGVGNGIPLDGGNGTSPYQGIVGPSNNISIRTTNGSGVLQRSGYNYAAAAGNPFTLIPLLGTEISTNASTLNDKLTLNWQPIGTANAQGQVSGTLTLTEQPLHKDFTNAGSAVTVSTTNITVNVSMNIGVFGSSGGNLGNMAVDIASMTFNGQKGQEPVQVNYLNSLTQKPIMSSTTILANVSDNIGIGPSQIIPTTLATTGNTYVFTPPTKPTGYQSITYPSSNITVQTFDSVVQTNPNVLNVLYAPDPAKVWWNYNWAFNTYGAYMGTLTSLSQTGNFGDVINAPTINVPAGYHVAAMKEVNGTYLYYPGSVQNTIPSGTNWVDITQTANGAYPATTAGLEAAAIAASGGTMLDVNGADPGFNTGISSTFNNQFGIYLEANKETPAITYAYSGATNGSQPALPANISLPGGFGQPLGLGNPSNWSQSGTTYTASLDSKLAVTVPAGMVLSSITAPNGTNYDKVTNYTAPTATSAGSVTLEVAGGTSTQTFTVKYQNVGANPVPSNTSVYPTALSTNANTALLQALGLAFPYGDSTISTTTTTTGSGTSAAPYVVTNSNNQFVINLAQTFTGSLNDVWANNTPGTNGNVGQLQGSLPAPYQLPSGAAGTAITFPSSWGTVPAGYSLVAPVTAAATITSLPAGVVSNAMTTPTGLTFSNLKFTSGTFAQATLTTKSLGTTAYGIITGTTTSYPTLSSASTISNVASLNANVYYSLVIFNADGSYLQVNISPATAALSNFTIQQLLQRAYPSYNATGNNYSVAIQANSYKQTWSYILPDGTKPSYVVSLTDKGVGDYAGQLVAPQTGAPLRNLSNWVMGKYGIPDTLLAGTYIQGYEIAYDKTGQDVNGNSLATDPDNGETIFPTFAALKAKYPVISSTLIGSTAAGNDITNADINVLVTNDQTALSANFDTTIMQGNTYHPLNDLTGSNNFDNSTNSNDTTVNGQTNNVIMTIQEANIDWSGTGNYIGGSSIDATTNVGNPINALDPNLAVNSLKAGNYLVAYYTLNKAGTLAYQIWLSNQSLTASTANLIAFFNQLPTSGENGDGLDSTGTALFTDYTTSTNATQNQINGVNYFPDYSINNGEVINTTAVTRLTVLPPFDLPFTGGEGLAGIVLVATVAGFGAISLKKKKNQEEQETFDEKEEDKK